MMTKLVRGLLTVCLFVLILCGIGRPVFAETHDANGLSPRQYYSDWVSGSEFSYRAYYYKPSPEYAGFKTQFVIYTPEKPDYLYYFNPYEKKFWGRIKLFRDGEPFYSILREEDRKNVLAEIPESAFPEPGPLPPMPDVADNILLDLPPDDSPSMLASLIEDAKINKKS
jgi:hypothetical protein